MDNILDADTKLKGANDKVKFSLLQPLLANTPTSPKKKGKKDMYHNQGFDVR